MKKKSSGSNLQLERPPIPLPSENERKAIFNHEEPESEDSKLISAEQATVAAIEFLKGLGIKKTIPNKASFEGDKAYVELDMKNKKAAILVDGKTEDILEYEIEKSEKNRTKNEMSVSPKLFLMMIGIQVLIVFAFDLVKNYLSFLFPF